MSTTNKETTMTTTNTKTPRREWVAVLHGQNGTIKIAYRNPASLAQGLAGQTKEGWVVASVYERDAQTTPDE